MRKVLLTLFIFVIAAVGALGYSSAHNDSNEEIEQSPAATSTEFQN
ncbi:hypothetical protein J18TS1_21980 [Oceanobacillus oncorhynchi subsp. incaldanensis]|uniref:Uncharacterized protein n=2 Tax=Oceanobacillus TaxID=182709 RepID=A0A0A1MC68_9BACI|nr:hypothetical protein [Oceanobacillus oncorhynchi]MDM8098915.1 hypothetical protein [Oceanobacillus oncorhynchi]UUI39697.1 hypothetical protein NP440_20625 [Oceanobacillus oncorhynchi]GIO19098.1 hypothetical protein J18TS1_21980 [Oceanobacillus oncorhynchi subsp. incaldanensis]CEI80668.1 hypothetical protein BN997_00475 [Oceanobacillus oncorhynchi]